MTEVYRPRNGYPRLNIGIITVLEVLKSELRQLDSRVQQKGTFIPAGINLVGVNLSIEHEVGFVEDVPNQQPMEVLVRVCDRLTRQTKTQKSYHEHDDNVDHILDLKVRNYLSYYEGTGHLAGHRNVGSEFWMDTGIVEQLHGPED